MGLRFAGTHDKDAKACLLYHLDRLMRICSLKGINLRRPLRLAITYDETICRINLRAFQDAVAVSLAAIMAGSGDLDVLRRLRRLHGRRSDEANYGGHMATHMAIGLLFMSGGQYTLGTSPLATAALFCATYPKFPTSPSENGFHLQALRHLWTLAAEKRCLVPRSVDTFKPTLVPIKIHLKASAANGGASITCTAPCLLPDLSSISAIETTGTEFQHVVLDFAAVPSLLEHFKQTPLIFVLRTSITTAFRTCFEQGLARVVTADSKDSTHGSDIVGAVQNCLHTAYLEEELGVFDGSISFVLADNRYPRERTYSS
jgi:anaphase-promoting complex subunit 1